MTALSICLLSAIIGIMAERFIDAYEERTEVLRGDVQDSNEQEEDGQ